MITAQRVSVASTAFSGLLANRPWLGPVGQMGGPPLERLNCFLGRPWYKAAHELSDPALQRLVRELVATLAPRVPGTDHDTWRYFNRTFLRKLSKLARTTITSGDVVRLWVATMIWGFVGDNRGPGRVVRALGGGLATVAPRLQASVQWIDQGNLMMAYSYCLPNGGSYLAGIGRSFFTKWLWAVGLGLTEPATRPLPQDDKVRTTATQLGPAWKFVGRNEGVRYRDYCELAEAVAGHLAPNHGALDAEKVEYTLFCA
jgi:hypothetical protein